MLRLLAFHVCKIADKTHLSSDKLQFLKANGEADFPPLRRESAKILFLDQHEDSRQFGCKHIVVGLIGRAHLVEFVRGIR